MEISLHQSSEKRRKKIAAAGLKEKGIYLLKILEQDLFQIPPPYEKPIGDLEDAYSRRINIKHRLVYQILDEDKIVKIIRMWTHYE